MEEQKIEVGFNLLTPHNSSSSSSPKQSCAEANKYFIPLIPFLHFP